MLDLLGISNYFYLIALNELKHIHLFCLSLFPLPLAGVKGRRGITLSENRIFSFYRTFKKDI